MKTAPLTPPSLQFIDTAPLAARYGVLIVSLIAMIGAGRGKDVLRLSYKVKRLVKLFIRLDIHNHLLARKLDMLSTPAWRARVLQELGGLRKLKLWEAAQDRFKARAAKKCRPKEQYPDPSWRHTPQRMAESERLKAHARDCAKACAPSNIMRDRCTMDFEGQFRLAPLQRAKGSQRRRRIYLQGDICDYRYNAVPFRKVTGLGPAALWPAEFYAAMAAEDEETENTPNIVMPQKARSAVHAGPNHADSALRLGPRLRGDDNKVVEDNHYQSVIPLHAAIHPKTYRALFENPV